MFRTDEMLVREKMEDIRNGVEKSRLQSKYRKNKKRPRPPFRIGLITFLKKF